MKDDGRDERGRFAVGNAGGPGSPLAGRSAKLRAVLLDEVGPDEMRRVVRVVLQAALDGDLRACRDLMDRGHRAGSPWPDDRQDRPRDGRVHRAGRGRAVPRSGR
jgi:hypothetical protein